jgi:hypothetical protein
LVVVVVEVAMKIAISEPGTYLASDGGLVHCRLDRAGELRIDIERASGTSRTLEISAKLSDDPDWPDAQATPGELIPLD